MQTQTPTGRLVFTVTWQAKPGEEAALVEIVRRFLPQARQEPGTQLVTVQRVANDPGQFLFYEVFDDEAAFAAHQETAHFRTLILEEALPRLAKRERTQYAPL
ncbi:MAG: antibiotic biosynthesis monooxygenase [Acetobacteraceae bacterium]|nr:antibiotic biosynthesis monooxygenase [Acetobacteraceae bacterium]